MNQDVEATVAAYHKLWLATHPKVNPHNVAAFVTRDRAIEVTVRLQDGSMRTVWRAAVD